MLTLALIVVAGLAAVPLAAAIGGLVGERSAGPR